MKRLLMMTTLIIVLLSTDIFSDTNEIKAIQEYKAGELLYKQQKYDEALLHLKKSFELKNDGKVANNIAVLYTKLKQEQNALSWFAKAAKLESPSAFYHLGRYYEKLNDSKKAIKLYTKASQFNHTKSIKRLASIYLSHSDNQLLGVAYTLALIDRLYTQHDALRFLQKKLLPIPYKGVLTLQ
jgi:TPR repeat protein